MFGRDGDPVLRLAECITDGVAVDWASLEGDRLVEPRTLDALRFLQSNSAVGMAAAAAPGSIATTERLEEGYEILEVIERRAASRICKARDRGLGRTVALKVVDVRDPLGAHARDGLVREARALAAIEHRNVVRVYAIAEEAGEFRVAHEWIEGRTLERILRDDGSLDESRAAFVAAEVASALSHVHERGLVHRDVKPSNVMVELSSDRIVLIDFGLVSPMHSDGTGDFAGTPLFMAPEQFDARSTVGPGADLYALGVLMYWMVSGGYPFAGPSLAKLADNVRHGRATSLPERFPRVEPWYAAIVTRCLALQAADRFASAGELERALRDHVAD